ncbi:MAG: tyrosine-type recombinase/integrase, partial [Vicinamibacteria bacterium]
MSEKAERLFRRFEEHLRVGYAERTVPDYLAHVRSFLAWLTENAIELVDVRSTDLQTYQNQLLGKKKKDGRPYSLGNHLNRLTALKSFFGFLYENGYVLQDPSRHIELKRRENKLPRVILTPGEVRRLIESANEPTPLGLRDRAILETFYATGIRVSELARLTPADVDTDERTVSIVQGKGRKDRNVPLTGAAAEAIDAYLERARAQLARSNRAPYLFLADKGGRLHTA